MGLRGPVFDSMTKDAPQRVQSLRTAVGTPADIAAVVADHPVTADVKGYQSHGVHRLGHYVGQVGNQEIAPAARQEDEGVSLPQPIWEQLTGLGDKYGVDWRHLQIEGAA